MDKKRLLGLGGASLAGFLQGLEGIIFAFLGLFFAFSIYSSVGFSISSLAIKETMILIIMLLFIGPSRFKKIINSLIKYKSPRDYLKASVGTTLGNLTFIIGIQLGGASYGVILTSLFPVFSMLFIKLVDKSKESWKVWLGVGIATIASMLFVLLPAIVKKEEVSASSLIGVLMGGIAAILWSLESMYLHKVSHNKNADFKTSKVDSVIIRTVGSLIIIYLLLMPLSGALSAIKGVEVLTNPYKMTIDLLSNQWVVLLIFAMAINLIILRIIYMFSIQTVGAKISAFLGSNSFLVPSILSYLLVLGNFVYKASDPIIPIFTNIEWWSWFIIILLLIGNILVIFYHKSPDNAEDVIEVH